MSTKTPQRSTDSQPTIATGSTTSLTSTPTASDHDHYGRSDPCKGCGYDPVDSGWTLVESSGGFGPALASVECPGCDEIVAFTSAHDWAPR